MNLLFVISWTLFLGFLGVLVVTYRHLTHWRGKGIPYVTGLPIIGLALPLFLRQKSFPEMIREMYNTCPGSRYFGFIDSGRSAILIKDPKIIRDIGVKFFENFPNHRSFANDDFDPLLSKNLFLLRNERWRDMRSTLTPSFTANKMKYMFTLVQKCSTDFVRYLNDHPRMIDEFDTKDAYTRFTNDVIATTAFGLSVDSMQDRRNEFYENGKSATTFDFSRFLKFFVIQFVPKLMRWMNVSFLPKHVENFFRKIIRDTVRIRDENGTVRPDMISLLMRARDNDNNIEITDDDIVAQAFVFFVAGFETSSRLMCFLSHTLAHHPNVQTKLRNEIGTVLAHGEMSYENLMKMTYLDAVVSETLRLYPPMPFTDRICSKPFTLPPSMEGFQEFTVQPDTIISLPIFGLHRDPKYFDEPEKFDPERFVAENHNSIDPYTYIPFGLGPRKCIGDRFALMEAKILIVDLLQSFILKPSSNSTRDIEFSKKPFDMTPVNGFFIRLESRK